MKTSAENKHRMPIFEERFKSLREAMNMTQDAFAEFLGISRPTVGFYEKGSRIPDAEVLCNIAKKCNITSDWLIGLTDQYDADAALVERTTGLSFDAIDMLDKYCAGDENEPRRIMTNAFIASEHFGNMINSIMSCLEYLENTRRYMIGEGGGALSDERRQLVDGINEDYIDISRFTFTREAEHIYEEMIIQFSEKFGRLLLEARLKEDEWLKTIFRKYIRTEAEKEED